MSVLPTIRMVSPRLGEVIVNRQDRDRLLAEGWSMPGNEPPTAKKPGGPPPPAAPAVEPPPKPTPAEVESQLVKLNVPELREMAKGLKVEDAPSLAKRPLIEAIVAARFSPPKE